MSLNGMLEDIYNALLKQRVVDSSDIKVIRTGGGTQLQILNPGQQNGGASVASSAIICQITSGTTASGYAINLYANGKDQSVTGTATLQIIDQAFADNLASGEWYYVDPTTITLTGGGD